MTTPRKHHKIESMPKTALLLIDVQKGFYDPYWGKRNNPDFEKNTENLLAHSRQRGWTIYMIQHCSTNKNSPLQPNLPGCQLMDIVTPRENEQIITKTVNSAFIETSLQKSLEENHIQNLVISGLTTDHCVSTTTRMASNFGFNVTLIADATATFDRTDINGTTISADEIHRIHLASLKDEFAKITTLSELTEN